MRRLALVLAATLLGTLVAPASYAYAYADAPAIAVSDVTLTPGASSPGTVVQTITYTDLPVSTDLDYMVPQDLGITGLKESHDLECAGGGGGFWGTCFHLSGSGTITITYDPSQATAGFTGPEGVNVRVQSLSLTASGTVHVNGRSDLGVSVTTSNNSPIITIGMTVFNTGPSPSQNETLTITGFAQPVQLPSIVTACQSGGLTVTCSLAALSAGSAPGGSCAAPSCGQLSLLLTNWTPTPLTIKVSGPNADPDTSNNTGHAFSDAPPAQPNPGAPPVVAGPGGGGPGTKTTEPGPGAPAPTGTPSPAPSSSAEPTPTEVTTGPLAAGPPVVPVSTGTGGSGSLWLVIAGLVVLLLLLAGGGLFTWQRLRPRPAATPAPPAPADPE
jgi:hypothetical protein